MSARILRGRQTYGPTGRLPLSRSKFYDAIVLHDEADPNIPGTDIPRVRIVKLAGNASGFVEGEIDRVNAALIKLRDATPFTPFVRKPKADAVPAKAKRSKKKTARVRM